MTGAIEIDGVSFAYDGVTEVLRDVSLDIRPGEILALVGPSGSGKTTLVGLLPRLWDVTSGAIRLDGHDVRGLTTASLREQIGLVAQEAVLFGGTVRDNIRYGRLDATDAEIEAAARAANAHDFITALPDGYETLVGDRGSRLSGGQRQRIAIARAILKDPPILLLDEATSSLDNESERLVQEALERLEEGRTTIIVAHRLSTIRGATRIAVLDDGWLVELGSHDELLAQGGLYARLYRLQFEAGDGEAGDGRRAGPASPRRGRDRRRELTGWRRRGQPNQVETSSSDTDGMSRICLIASGESEVRRETSAAIRDGSWWHRRRAARSRRGQRASARRSSAAVDGPGRVCWSVMGATPAVLRRHGCALVAIRQAGTGRSRSPPRLAVELARGWGGHLTGGPIGRRLTR